MTIGGGTRLWQAQAWRFLPEDFQMASTYGMPNRSSLTDWPINYDQMEPLVRHGEIVPLDIVLYAINYDQMEPLVRPLTAPTI